MKPIPCPWTSPGERGCRMSHLGRLVLNGTCSSGKRVEVGKRSFALLLALALVSLSLGPLGMSAVPTAAAASAGTYYVSPNGSDNVGLGTLESPWRTIGHAVSAAAAGDTVKVMDDDNEATDDYVEEVTVGRP